MRFLNLRRFFTIAIILLIELLFFLSFTWIVVPDLEQVFFQAHLGLWFFNVVLAIAILIVTLKSLRLPKNASRTAKNITSICFLIVYLPLAGLILYIMYFAVLLKGFPAFFCGEDFTDVAFPHYGKTVYLKNVNCIDGYTASGHVYMQRGHWPLMKEIFSIQEGSFKQSGLRQNVIY